ncbi:MAG: hypothetical protein ACI84R_002148, partial [Candidatus Azotimanducaceae bacterium]
AHTIPAKVVLIPICPASRPSVTSTFQIAPRGSFCDHTLASVCILLDKKHISAKLASCESLIGRFSRSCEANNDEFSTNDRNLARSIP